MPFKKFCPRLKFDFVFKKWKVLVFIILMKYIFFQVNCHSVSAIPTLTGPELSFVWLSMSSEILFFQLKAYKKPNLELYNELVCCTTRTRAKAVSKAPFLSIVQVFLTKNYSKASK